jgi:putative intracellular protease/amidase
MDSPPYVIGIVVYNDVDLLDVAVPAELFNWMGVVEQQSALNKPQRVVRLVSADGPSVVTRDGLSLGAALPPLEDAGTIHLLWVPGADLRSLGTLKYNPRPPFGDGDPTVAEQPSILAPGATDYIETALAPFIDRLLERGG